MSTHPPITAEDVIREASVTLQTPLLRLDGAIKLTHDRGYHAYSAELQTFRNDLETALNNLTERLVPS